MKKIKDDLEPTLNTKAAIEIPNQKVRGKSKRSPLFYSQKDDQEEMIVEVNVMLGCENLKSPEGFYVQGLCELTGTENRELAEDIIHLGASAICGNESNAEKRNIVVQSLSEYKPKDAHEARLCTQASALYSHGMKFLYRAEKGNNIDHCEFFTRNAMKFLRLHNETIEALNKHRRGGEQRVVVQYVNVSNGGQAIVGGVLNGGGGKQ